MSYPDKASAIELLATWKTNHDAVESMMNDVEKSIGLDIDGPLFFVVWGLFFHYTTAIGELIGDHGEWLPWFINENQMGKKAMDAGYDGKLRKVKTLEHLYGLISESRKRKEAA
ncbi:MAG: hypothetical protein RL710_1157 [Pseudomonadota bacterium]|jgi:hypothetical protein